MIHNMKKVILILAVLALGSAPASAQLGGLLQKAAQQTMKKATDNLKDKANAAVTTTVEQPQETREAAEEAKTIADVMKMVPSLPTAQQLVNHKTAQLKEQTFKLLTSPVTVFTAKVTELAMQAASLAVEGLDSAQVTEMAYKQTEAATGLSREELDALSKMSDEEQEAYLAAHYKQGTAEMAVMQQAADAAKYLEPLQPMIDQWDALGEKVEGIYRKAEEQSKEIYAKFAPQLATASEEVRKDILLKYYAEVAPLLREAVQEGMNIRLNDQLPVAEDIEKKMKEIRAKHQDIISALLNYPQLTATQYFTDLTRMMEIPEYSEN